MAGSNRPITSREFKLMLNVHRFVDRAEGAAAFWEIVEFMTEKHDGEVIETQDEEKERRTWYVDTRDRTFRHNLVVLRLRDDVTEPKDSKITLKYRNADRYVSAARDLSSPVEKAKTKFEEDILPPFTSKFAHSTSIKKKHLPGLDNGNISDFDVSEAGKVAALFPGLDELGLAEETPLWKVNSFKAHEVVRWLGKIQFGGEPTVSTCLSFWYLRGLKHELPLVGELSFDYDAAEGAEEDALEQFPAGVVEGTNRFFKSMQRQRNWISSGGTTKTAFAYEGF